MLSFEILGVRVSAVNLERAYAFIESMVRDQKAGYVCVAPVSTIVAAVEDSRYKQVIDGAAMVTPDGMPVVWLAHGQGFSDVKRTYGPDLMRLVCGRGQTRGFRHYLLGGTPEVNTLLAERLESDYPAIRIAGRYAPPFRPLTGDEEKQMIQSINDSGAQVVWVGLGSPKQDFWMAEQRDKIKAPVMVGVGAAFDFIAGHKKQAPRWIQNIGMEWFFRLCCEPRRLWRRYLIGNMKFIYYLVSQNGRKR